MGGLGSSLFAAAAERRGGVRGASGVFEGAELGVCIYIKLKSIMKVNLKLLSTIRY